MLYVCTMLSTNGGFRGRMQTQAVWAAVCCFFILLAEIIKMWPSVKNPILCSGHACVLLKSYILSVTRVEQLGWCLEVDLEPTSICICLSFDGPLWLGSLATPPQILSDFDLRLMFSLCFP